MRPRRSPLTPPLARAAGPLVLLTALGLAPGLALPWSAAAVATFTAAAAPAEPSPTGDTAAAPDPAAAADTAAAAADGGLLSAADLRGEGPDIGLALARQRLPRNDGWAAADGGTSGGAAADRAHVYTVTDRAQLVHALTDGVTATAAPARIIAIRGTVDAGVDEAGNPLSCTDYQTDGYTRDAYLATYDPAVWGRSSVPSGALEDARAASARRQAERVQLSVPSNTTIIGVGPGAQLIGANLLIGLMDPVTKAARGVRNVIVRNLSMESPVDCFPQWDPTDGSSGNWNSAYDAISVIGSTHVWVDHLSLTDGRFPDASLPSYFGRKYQQHDGELDISKGADLVTVSWNRFANHDKTLLIGSTDNPATDQGKLRVTVHHNHFLNVLQRLPRVRFGQVHVYDNYTELTASTGYVFALGVGVGSAIYAQNNYYRLPSGIAKPGGNDGVIKAYGGTAIHTEGDVLNGAPVDLLANYNATHDPDLSGDVGWTPTLVRHLDPAMEVPDLVRALAGARRVLSVDGRASAGAQASTVQAAIDAIGVNNATAVTVSIAPGTYHEVVRIPGNKPFVTLAGRSHDAARTEIAYDNWSGTIGPDGKTLGTTGSATVRIDASDVSARSLTFANTFDEASQPQTNQHQAVALRVSGDRMRFDNIRVLGDQDSLYLTTNDALGLARQLFRDSYVEGTVDMIFGRATAVFVHDTLQVKDYRGGTLTAPSTEATIPNGLLIDGCRLTSPAADGTVYLGRPWPQTATARPMVTVRDSWISAAFASSPWLSWTSPAFPWQNARFAEYANQGPGAGTGPDRPQLTAEQAAAQTPAAVLAGQDAWTPGRLGEPDRR